MLKTKMQVAIVEINHFQYGLTMSEIFEEHSRIFFVTKDIYDHMLQYSPEYCDGIFIVIESLQKDYKKIIETCNEHKVDLFILNPVFGSFDEVANICESLSCQKIITIHNLNFWLRSKFRTFKYYKERKLKQRIVSLFDYIVVEDIVYQYLKLHDTNTFNKYKFLSIPFTLTRNSKPRKYNKEESSLKIVLPGSIHKDRRKYEDIVKVIYDFAKEGLNFTFSFAGQPIDEYGQKIIEDLKVANKIKPGIAKYYPLASEITPDMFLKEMETADIVLSTSTTEFKALGTTEYIGKTKSTGTIHDMTCFQLPGLLPSHILIPKNLSGSVLNYSTAADLKNILLELLNTPEKLSKLKERAILNSIHYTAEHVRRNLPFFYNQCSRCIMDNTNDPEIFFDNQGHCNYCNSYFEYVQKESTLHEYTLEKIKPILENIKSEGVGKKYDCIVGISGGTDSAFLVYKLIELGLRPLAVHFDNSWNSETASQNIEVLLNKLNVDLYTSVIDWEEFKDLQISFLHAGVIDVELITDLAIIGLLYKTSVKYNTKYIFTGHNTSTEFILPTSWYHFKLDSLNIKSIHKKYGRLKLKTFPYLSYAEQYYHAKFRKTKVIALLDYINYNKSDAQKLLAEKLNWKNYGGKHNESIFTRFYQNYILPVKFNVDKRKAHLSSLVCSGQITREDALHEMKTHIWETPQTIEDKKYVLKKLGLSEETFDKWMKEKPVSHFKFASYITHHNEYVKTVKKLLGQ